MIKIYHNPRCRKSREGLQLLEKYGKKFQIIKYLEDIPTQKELNDIIIKLGVSPIQLVRKNEIIWKEKFKAKELSEQELVKAMVDYPKLIERPIVVHNHKAIIGRPSEKILTIL